ncbi:unnamed protein product, partial [Adineta steineri]
MMATSSRTKTSRGRAVKTHQRYIADTLSPHLSPQTRTSSSISFDHNTFRTEHIFSFSYINFFLFIAANRVSVKRKKSKKSSVVSEEFEIDQVEGYDGNLGR